MGGKDVEAEMGVVMDLIWGNGFRFSGKPPPPMTQQIHTDPPWGRRSRVVSASSLANHKPRKSGHSAKCVVKSLDSINKWAFESDWYDLV